ncbi:PREDICTED: uncharacterized protein LOC108765029 [Trachymyrmex cornetzi]|uniref:Uncharacterized protein n=1 Tax=Trachymyrmex cornetzi TaxID=471704 RepID=A0A195DS72_9HYME|nr:PREDICTED: uncharacterized protein LOC108765029 [Trachymyrmex cornetzi]XP_018368997.1 PREDICTED: uncharacterized protein LOC108765029 [Trachymyrmex cornetzi]XP_018368998.1 PREDICTED: uncharacterized protein LOC108765029 [Trachymyrmex cornetzi]XP_018368999.1 PREDICTED: uncharacterized protein LOC108765029 [Trachymyrmex cornetzi]KYN15369.1 hypothetical protein ALC57_12418 [Trachymyrmex cornetzi]
MQLPRTFLRFGCYFLVLTLVTVAGQNEPLFELPVQLIGFPVIIASVRIANFLKKLAYALNPDTYVSRVKRAHPLIHDEEILDVNQVEKKLVAELGNNVCIYEKICVKYAERSLQRRSWERVLNWNEVFREYKSSSNSMKENYLLSVFMGDIIGSPKLCHLLAKRGRACDSSLFDKTRSTRIF